MELADMQDLGSCAERRGGSSPFIRTILKALKLLHSNDSKAFAFAIVPTLRTIKKGMFMYYFIVCTLHCDSTVFNDNNIVTVLNGG